MSGQRVRKEEFKEGLFFSLFKRKSSQITKKNIKEST